ncbi:MAG: ROK family protein [Dactylosporangium sp.]|nr:ROK family protein [Dactylosporangium sp.]NNJ60250.1 ROK family protein [Dactylosporangium sp.]
MIIGIDIGGSGIKGAPVDVSTGTLSAERYRVETPSPANVTNITTAVRQVVERFGATDRVGVTFPGVVVGGVAKTAANVDISWLEAPVAKLLSAAVDRPATVLNDADAAGIAEITFGAGKGKSGVVVLLTFGTGIGSAVFLDGRLLPNTELGHLEIRGKDAEERASDRIRETKELDWSQWALRLEEYLRHVERLIQPDLIVIGGGVSKKRDKYLHLIDVRTPVVTASLQNNAGIIGAAIAAAG